MQSGMRETKSQVVRIGQISAPVLQALVRFMYGDLVIIPHKMLVPLMVAADAHQVDLPDLHMHGEQPSLVLATTCMTAALAG